MQPTEQLRALQSFFDEEKRERKRGEKMKKKKKKPELDGGKL